MSSPSSTALSLTNRQSSVMLSSNLSSATFIHTFMAILSGCISGLLGLTGFYGFLFYSFSFIFVSILLYNRITSLPLDKKLTLTYRHHNQKNVNGDIALSGREKYEFYFPIISTLWDGYTGGILSFLLFWTLAYDIVYIY